MDFERGVAPIVLIVSFKTLTHMSITSLSENAHFPETIMRKFYRTYAVLTLA